MCAFLQECLPQCAVAYISYRSPENGEKLALKCLPISGHFYYLFAAASSGIGPRGASSYFCSSNQWQEQIAISNCRITTWKYNRFSFHFCHIRCVRARTLINCFLQFRVVFSCWIDSLRNIGILLVFNGFEQTRINERSCQNFGAQSL